MKVVEKIIDHVNKMQESEQVEVPDFIDYLETNARQRKVGDEEEACSAVSLASAMRGMEEEPSD